MAERKDSMHKVKTYLVTGALLFGFMAPAMAQDDCGGNYNRDQNRGSDQNRGNNNNGNYNRGNDNRGDYQSRGNYYGGMNDRVRQGDYGRYVQQDESRHHHESGGIGPGKGALIGGAGGAALGAIFGGGLKGTLIGRARVSARLAAS